MEGHKSISSYYQSGTDETGQPNDGVCSPSYWIKELKSILFWRAMFIELIATIIFISFILFMDVSNDLKIYRPNPTVSGLAVGFLFFVLVEAYEGPHFNPAVSLALLVSGRISPVNALFRIALQFAAAGISSEIGPALTEKNYEAILPNVSSGHAVVIEMLLTFNFCYVLVSTMNPANRPRSILPGFATGATLAIGTFVATTHTGATMNPAVPFTHAIISHNYDRHWVYWVGPCTGALLAGLIYNLLDYIKSYDQNRDNGGSGLDEGGHSEDSHILREMPSYSGDPPKSKEGYSYQ